ARQVAEMHDATIVLERLIRYSSDAIEMLDLDGRVLRWNGGCENLYGFTAEEVIGERLPHHPEEHRSAVVARFRATAASGRVDEYDAVARRQDGSLVGVSLVVIPVNDGDGNPAAVLAVACEAGGDTRFERTREDFLTVVSSQIKGPLTAILGYAQLLSRPEILADASRRSRTLAALEQHTAQMATVVDDLLLVSGTDDTTPVLDLEPLDLGLVVSETVKAFEQHNASHRFLIDFDTSIPALSGDRRRIERAVTSLLENAVAYSPIGSAVAVSVLLDGVEAIIEVTDTGVGIEPGDLEHVFERFYRGEGAENRQRPGVGIGLHLVKRIADAHGGSVSVESDPGHGSTFAIRLPASAPKRAVR
ncbi:MAG: PAS domain-containing sensor histidine kinase, partial [Actinomycetota bacterium]|nr:PAS domain-containing sensor histidine kinase [Actinomycetota bacterium]